MAGIYGVIALSTARRTRELAMRVALGARRAEVLRLVVSSSMYSTAAGMIAGVVLAAVLTRRLQGLLFGLTTVDAASFAAAVGFFTVWR